MMHTTDVTRHQQLWFLFQELVNYILPFKLPARNSFCLFRQQRNLPHL